MPRRSASVDPTKDDGTGWAGLLPGADYPSVEDPPDQQLWSANSRQFAGPRQALIGDGGADLGARATQLRDLLSAQPRHDETSLSKAMLDDRALFMSTWRAHALRADFAFAALQGGTHDIIDEQPEAWAAAVTAFLRG